MYEPKSVLILFSGGIDSSACVNYYKKLGFDISLLFIDYAQPAAKHEEIAVGRLAEHFGLPYHKLEIRYGKSQHSGLILGRNAMLYFLALTNLTEPYGLIASGIHYGTGYYDCSALFLEQLQLLFANYTDQTVVAEAPFINFTKVDIITYCVQENIPLELTYSCENGFDPPCGQCASCKDLLAIYERKNQ